MRSRLFAVMLLSGILLRVAIFWIPGNSVRTPWSGGGDMDAYILLAGNIAAGDGYSYAHEPSAFRPPGYPATLAALMKIFGTHFVMAARCLQTLAGLAAAYFAFRAGRIWFGEWGGGWAAIASLWFPTLAYFSGEILSESLASFFVALFLWALAEDSARPRWATAAAMGALVAAAALYRPNAAALGAVALVAAWMARRERRAWLEVALVPLFAGMMIAPWVARNWVVFHKLIFTTQGGCNALSAVINPEARLMPDAEGRMQALMGTNLPNDLETNSRERRIPVGPEADLGRRCMAVTVPIWKQMGWGLVPWAAGKATTFWLSTDQFQSAEEAPLKRRLVHAGGVFLYWALLALATAGWWRLRKERPEIAVVLLGYAVLVTLAHTPFVMNSRIRTPLMDPLLAMLAGGAARPFRAD